MADVESPGVSETPKGKESKFSNRETALIMKTIRDYVSDNNLELSDVCRTLRESKEEEKRTLNRHTVWKVLGELLPHRTVKNIYLHACRKFLRATNHEPWSEEDKQTLLQLVASKGTRWSDIGRFMHRLDDDCKTLYLKLTQPRKKKGTYTEEEDQALLLAIQRHTNTRGQSIADIPMKNLPWTAIADDLGNQRTPLDYLRHWPNLRRSLLITWGEGGIRKQDVSIAVKVAVEKKAKVETDEIELHQTILLILRCLNDRVDADDDIVDESDIRWADIDRLCGLSYGEAARRWHALCKQYPSHPGNFQAQLRHLTNLHPADEDDDDVGNISSKVLPTTAKSPSINSTASMVKFKSPVKSKRKRAVIEENVEAASKEMNEADISMEIFGDDSDNDEVEVVNDHSHQSTSGNMIVEEDVDAARAAKKLRKQEKRERRAKRRLKKMRLSEATQAHNGANISMETLDDNDDEEVDITDDYTYLDNSGVMIDSVVKDEDDDDDEAARIAKKLRKQERRERRERKRLKKLRQSEEAV